jgi:hypothetical protein
VLVLVLVLVANTTNLHFGENVFGQDAASRISCAQEKNFVRNFRIQCGISVSMRIAETN